nr:hypothetical protein [Clostridia bacterium]
MSDNTIKTNTRLPVITAEKRIDGECSGDYILPDTVADIKRVLRVTPRLIPGARYRDGKTVFFEGRAIYNALIVTEENKLAKLTYEEPYSDSIEIEYKTDDPQISIRPEPGALSWRIVNQRKLGIKLKICTHVTVTEKQETKPDTASLNPTELQKDEVTLPSVCVYTAAESGRLCEDIELEGTLPQIGGIIDCRCELTVNECKCVEGSVQ